MPQLDVLIKKGLYHRSGDISIGFRKVFPGQLLPTSPFLAMRATIEQTRILDLSICRLSGLYIKVLCPCLNLKLIIGPLKRNTSMNR